MIFAADPVQNLIGERMVVRVQLSNNSELVSEISIFPEIKDYFLTNTAVAVVVISKS